MRFDFFLLASLLWEKMLNNFFVSKRRKSSMKKNAVYSAPKRHLGDSWWRFLLPPTLLSFITLIFYYPSLSYPFQFDDLANISKNYSIRFFNSIWDFVSLDSGSRWVGEILLRLNYMWGKFDPWYYRVVNLTIHVFTGIFVFILIYKLCRKRPSDSFWVKNALELASATMGLFLLHPVQTQAVSYVIQARLEGLATFFIVMGLVCFVVGREASSIFVKTALYTLIIPILWLGNGSKEIIIVFPFLTLLIEWFFLSAEDGKKFVRTLWIHAIFLFFVVGFMMLRLHFSFFKEIATLSATAVNNRGNVLNDNIYQVITPLHFLISEFKVILHYLWIFVWPFGISVEYDWVLSKSFFAADSFFPFLALLAILSAVFYGAFTRKFSVISFGMLWFFITVAPRTTIIPSSELLVDYKTYGAALGWLFVLAALLVRSAQQLRTVPYAIIFSHSQTLRVAAITLAMLPLGFSTLVRNYVWSDSELFWANIIANAPNKARGYNNYAVALGEKGRYAEALAPVKKAIQLDPVYSDPYNNLAVFYSNLGRDDEAIEALKEAIRIFPHYPEAYNNLGTLLIKKNRFDEAEPVLAHAIKMRPHYGKAYFNLGRLYYLKGNKEAALEAFKSAARRDLDVPNTFVTIGQLSLELQRPLEAAEAFQEAIKLGFHDENVMFSCANSYMMANNYSQAEKWYRVLVQNKPQDTRYVFNLAEALFRQGNYHQSLGYFKKCTEVPEPVSTAFVRLAECYNQQNKKDEAKKYFELGLALRLPAGIESHARTQYALLK